MKSHISSLLLVCTFVLIAMPLLNAQTWFQTPIAQAASVLPTCVPGDTACSQSTPPICSPTNLTCQPSVQPTCSSDNPTCSPLAQPTCLPGDASCSPSTAFPACSSGNSTCIPAFYGSYHPWMIVATSDWYQHEDFWCGIANIHAIQIYDWLSYNNTVPSLDNSQEAIYARLNDTHTPGVVSPWGYGGGYVKADISRDTGTDPRALAFGLWYETPLNSTIDNNQTYFFHNWIYSTDSPTATYGFSTDFGQNTVSHNDPISVTIDRGGHSFVVDGVWAASDPSISNTTVFAVDTWDPWLNHDNQPRIGGIMYNQFQNQIWSLYDWTTNPILWGEPYTTNYGNDPDPTMPPLSNNYYVPPFPSSIQHHWIGSYTTIEQDRVASVDSNIALDQNGHLAPYNLPYQQKILKT